MEPGDPALDEFVLEPAAPARCRASASCRPPAATRTSRSRRFHAAFGDRAVRADRTCRSSASGEHPVDLRDASARAGRRLRRRRLDAQHARDLARPRPRRDPARGVGAGHRARRAQRRARCAGSRAASRSPPAPPEPVAGLGLLPGSLSRAPRRRARPRCPSTSTPCASGALPRGLGGRRRRRRCCSQDRELDAGRRLAAGAALLRVEADGVTEVPVEALSSRPSMMRALDADVRELRSLRYRASGRALTDQHDLQREELGARRTASGRTRPSAATSRLQRQRRVREALADDLQAGAGHERAGVRAGEAAQVRAVEQPVVLAREAPAQRAPGARSSAPTLGSDTTARPPGRSSARERGERCPTDREVLQDVAADDGVERRRAAAASTAGSSTVPTTTSTPRRARLRRPRPGRARRRAPRRRAPRAAPRRGSRRRTRRRARARRAGTASSEERGGSARRGPWRARRAPRSVVRRSLAARA